MGAPVFFFIQFAFNLMIHAIWLVNVKNEEYHPQLVLFCFLDVLVATFVSLFFKCSLVMLLGSTLSPCLLFVLEFIPRLSAEQLLFERSLVQRIILICWSNCQIPYNVLSHLLRFSLSARKTTLPSWNYYQFR